MNFILRRRYLDLVRAGQKTTTIRYEPICRARVGDAMTLIDYRSPAVRAHCSRVEERRVADLTDADARADGFVSLHALRVALRHHYPTLSPRSRVWIVHFTLDAQRRGGVLLV